MNTKMNKSQFDWYMKWFKRQVRSIVWDLGNLPALSDEFGIPDKILTRAEREDLTVIIPRVKSYCIDLYKDYVNGERDIRCYVKDLKIHFKVYFYVDLLFLAREEPAMSPDEEPTHFYNSLSVNFEDLHFSLQEERYDDYLCEMAETNGMGYDYIESLMSEEDDEDDEGIENVEPEDLPF